MGIVLLLLVGQLVVGAGVVAAQSATITDVAYSDDGAVETGRDVLYLWRSSSHSFDVVIDNGGPARDVEVCLRTSLEDGTIACTAQRLPANTSVTATVSADAWPANSTGEQTVTVVVSEPDSGGGAEIASQTVAVTVLRRAGDFDADGVENSREISSGTRIDQNDTDEDGLLDGEELDTFGTDPTKADTDGDGLADDLEVNHVQADPTKADTDGDGLTDDLEVNEYETNPNNPDTDRDGLDDKMEVNSFQTDPGAADSDGDGLPDAGEVEEFETDPNTADTDGDGVPDGEEANVYETDPTKSDTDGDGLADDDEIQRRETDPAAADSDDDGLDDGPELNIYGTNPNKADTDGDGVEDGAEVQRGIDPTVPNENVGGGTFGLDSQSKLSLVGIVIGGVVVLALASLFYGTEPGSTFLERLRSIAHEPGEESPAADDVHDDVPVLSKQEKILRIVAENGDRIRQSELVERTGWSKSTVSRTLSKMEENGDITKIDVGRGNVVTAAGSEPENSRPPFEK